MSTYLVLIQFVQSLSFNFLNCIELACGSVLGLIDLCIFLSGAKKVNFFEILFSEHVGSLTVAFEI